MIKEQENLKMNPHLFPVITQTQEPEELPLKVALKTQIQQLEPSYSEVVVHEHTRRKPKVSQPCNKPGNKRATKKAPTMDVATFKTIVMIQKENMRLMKEQKKVNPDPIQESRKHQWTSFMKRAVRASKKSKGKFKSAARNAKRAQKERMERETEEFLDLRDKLQSDDYNFSAKDSLRYHYLKNHAILDERKLPGLILDYDPRQGSPVGGKYRKYRPACP